MILETVQKNLREKFPALNIDASIDERGIITLKGECDAWNQVVEAGHLAAKPAEVKNVVNELSVKGKPAPRKDYTPYCEAGLRIGKIDSVDVLIIGAGISGSSIARELAKYTLKILVVEQAEDVAAGASKANNGNIHPGHAVKPGTLKARLNVRGNRMYTQWSQELGFELQRCGALGASTEQKYQPAYEKALEIAKINGVDGPEVVDGKRIKELEPGFAALGIEPVTGLWLPSMGLVEPYKVAAALAENAAMNGVRFLFNCTVGDILHKDSRVTGAVTSLGIIEAPYIINCAGMYADEISAMAGDKSYTIHPRKGTIAILDKQHKPVFAALADVLGPTPSQKKTDTESKGGGMCRTPEWNILMGPSATEVPDKEDLSSTPEDLRYAMALGERYGINNGDIIRFFTGNRPPDYKEDFVIELSPVTRGFINVGGIQSPGLAAAPAVAEMVEGIFVQAATEDGRLSEQNLQKKPHFNPIRKQEIAFHKLSRNAQDELIRKNPAYGRIVCRCESVTEGEILDSLRSLIPARTIDAVKQRTRAGMGRCQGGFCQCRVLEILARELGVDKTGITLRGADTPILLRNNRLSQVGSCASL